MPSTSSGFTSPLSSNLVKASSLSWCSLWVLITFSKWLSISRSFFVPFPLSAIVSTSFSISSISSPSLETASWTHSLAFIRFRSSSDIACVLARPSFEYAFVFISLSTSLKASILRSIFSRASTSCCLFLISALEAHVLTWSRSFCSFLISDFSSPSSRCFGGPSAACTWSYISSNSNRPSSIFLRVRSTSSCSFLAEAMVIEHC